MFLLLFWHSFVSIVIFGVTVEVIFPRRDKRQDRKREIKKDKNQMLVKLEYSRITDNSHLT